MDTQSKIALAKMAFRFTVQSGTAKIVGTIIKNNCDPETITEKVQIYVATFAIGGYAANKIGEHTDQKVDEIIAQVTEWKAQAEKNKTQEQ